MKTLNPKDEPFDFFYEFNDHENGLLESDLELKPEFDEFETEFAAVPATSPRAAKFDFEWENFGDEFTDAEGTTETDTEWFESEWEEGFAAEISKPSGGVEAKRKSLRVWDESKLPAGTNGKLYRFDSKNGGSTTAVYVPDAALATDPLCLLMWIHGDLICGGEGADAVALVKSKQFPLAKQVADNRLSFVLVAPSMKWQKGQNLHTLGSSKMMNAFLEEVRTGLTGTGWSSAPSFGRLILAGHSRAYAVLNGLARGVSDAESSKGALAKLTDVWLLDTTYGKMHKQAHCANWMKWAKAKSGVNLRIFYRRNSDTAAVAECIRDGAAAAGLTNVVVKDFHPKVLSHCDMPRDRMPDLLTASGNCPARLKSPSVPRTPSSSARSAPSPAPRPTNGSLFQRIQNALASGQWYLAMSLAVLTGGRDANSLTNMIFFARHPKLKGKKLVTTDPNFKKLGQEWLDIRDRIVRPFLVKTVPAKPSGAKPTRPIVGGKHYPEVNTLLPSSGPGFIRRKREKQEMRSYGLPETIRALQEIAAEWHRADPRRPRIVISDISPQGGSLGRFEPHSSHRVGLDVDLNLEGGKANWYNKKGPKINNRWQWQKNPTYSAPLTAELARLILAHPKGGLEVKFILFDDPDVMRISTKVRKDPKSPHRDHFHVRFYAPAYFASRVDERYKSST